MWCGCGKCVLLMAAFSYREAQQGLRFVVRLSCCWPRYVCVRGAVTDSYFSFLCVVSGVLLCVTHPAPAASAAAAAAIDTNNNGTVERSEFADFIFHLAVAELKSTTAVSLSDMED